MTPFDFLPAPDSNDGLHMLAGITVIDLTTSVAGPYATQLLADMGATVIKVEKQLAGDDARAWGPPFLHEESLWFLSVNRNKQSVTLDISCERGSAVLDQLIASADVLVVNLGGRTQEKLGVDYARLAALHPALIHVSLTGFGLLGARGDLPCYDLIAEGYSGVMDLTGEPDNAPQKVGTPAADLLAGQDAAMAVMAALLERHRTGRGKQIDISMVRSMTRFMAPRIVPYLGAGEAITRSGGRDSVIAIYQVFQTADLPLTLGLGNNAIWQRFWKAVGEPDFGNDPRFSSNQQRREYRPEIVARISALLAQKNRKQWLEILSAQRIPAGPINRVDEVVQDPELIKEGLFYSAQTAKGKVPQVGLGIGFDGKTQVHRSPPPVLGEHTRTVLQDRLGMSADEITALLNDGII
ncbi:CoA transferase [Herbaspirillum sp. RTI4]|uniref:CaiB/BaiF CoA transferase family protein n=1 Tax=Herbaspirillum sp. RTI4 TaxID=3048640 RepID=UPI002AB56237|nr:CoA transferase [Herbaspirillum sp. RTI4]MDY7579122.1 CoA transferase [Herbaspirillum sp. RTI4]MEA9981299.1 CoA transferase [Herbaspirillum sp. RTI4]